MNITAEELIISDEFCRRGAGEIKNDLVKIYPFGKGGATTVLAFQLAASSGPSMRRTALNRYLYGS